MNKKRFFKRLVIGFLIYILFFVFKTISSPQDMYILSLNAGNKSFNQQDYLNAISFYQMSKDYAQRIKDNNDDKIIKLIRSYSSIAASYEEVNKINIALNNFNEAIILSKKLKNKNCIELARAYNDLANIYCYLGKYKEAKSLYKKSWDIKLNVSGYYSEDYAKTLNNYGLACLRENNFNEADKYLNNALTIRASLFGNKSPNLLPSLNGLLKLYKKTLNIQKERVVIKQINIIRSVDNAR